MLKILIVDDEPLARARLIRMISELNDCEVVGEAATGLEALAQAEAVNPDVILMDIRMPAMDGLAAAKHISEMETPPAVIFCTAYDDYALEAFSSQATGYLVKPVKRLELAEALIRAQHINRAQVGSLTQQQVVHREGREHVASKSNRGVELIPLIDVRMFQADSKYVIAHHVNGETLLDETLKDLEKEFGDKFVRIHRNALISLDHIESLERNIDGQYFARLSGIDIKPLVSRRHVAGLRHLLESI